MFRFTQEGSDVAKITHGEITITETLYTELVDMVHKHQSAKAISRLHAELKKTTTLKQCKEFIDAIAGNLKG